MSEAPLPPQEADQPSAGAGLMYAIFGAMSADLGCIIGALAFVLLVAASAYFAPLITPCTSAGGIPCAP
ncbi:MAG: hypothetical protein QOK05_2546 [Chloroflexota bacterium]|jgi:heme/copper-type cytochrome/quinol oxidase subunit 1|nr:hypothetical protein [Chloroflexota bacterium]